MSRACKARAFAAALTRLPAAQEGRRRDRGGWG